MKFIRPLLLVLGLLSLVAQAAAAERSTIQAILITASNEAGRSDPRLSSYEPTLRRILRFASYRYVGQGSVSLIAPSEGSISLGAGHSLTITAEESGKRGLRLRAQWQSGRRTLMETGLSLSPGVPAVLGGPGTGSGDEVYAIILVAK